MTTLPGVRIDGSSDPRELARVINRLRELILQLQAQLAALEARVQALEP